MEVFLPALLLDGHAYFVVYAGAAWEADEEVY